GWRRGFKHRLAAKRVDVDELHSAHRRRGKYGAGDSVGNIVEFQVEEDTCAQRGDFFDGGRTRGGKKLAADLEHSYKIGNQAGKSECGGQGVNIKGDDQAASAMGDEDRGHNRPRVRRGLSVPY